MDIKTEKKKMHMLEVAFGEVASKLHRLSILPMATCMRSAKLHGHFLSSLSISTSRLHMNKFIEVRYFQ
jgi:hypothetical protein